VEISSVKLKSLRKHVMDSGGVAVFCHRNPQFSDRSVFQILQGRRKRMSPGVVALFKHCGI